MINKTSIKKIIIPGIALIFIAILGFFIVSTIQNKKYEKIVNATISNFIDEIMEKYPETSEEDIIKILNDIENTNEKKEKMKILKKYGYTNNLSYIKKLENEMYSNMKFNIVVICVFGILILTIVLIYNRKKEREIKKINKYLNEINNGNYELKIEENCEDELSKLKNELYKTTVLLRETAENSEKAQAKAPVTIDYSALEASAKDFLTQVFAAMQLEVEIITKVDEDNKVIDVEFKGPEMGMLIGKRGQTLDSLQYLTNLAVNKQSESYIKVKLDTEDYRKRRKETLENLAKNIAYKVKRTKRPVSLEPMNPFERRVIHSALQNDKYVSTHSEGEEPYRHVVVTLKDNRR